MGRKLSPRESATLPFKKCKFVNATVVGERENSLDNPAISPAWFAATLLPETIIQYKKSNKVC